MTTKKRRMTAMIGLALGAAIFSGAAMADLPTSNGYEVGKTAVKGLMQNENYTMEASMALLVDDKDYTRTEILEKYDRNGDVQLSRSEKTTTDEEYSYYNSSGEYKTYYQDSQNIQIYKRADGSEEASISGDEHYSFHMSGSLDSFYDENNTEEDKNTQQKIVRFVELIGDTFVGDLKNNIIYVSGDDNSSTYEMSLDAMQIPEVVNAGAALLFSTNSGISSEDPMAQALGTDPVVKNVSLKFTVDGEKRLSDATLKVVAAGNGHEAAVECTMKIYDYGTTKPERVDVSTLSNVKRMEESSESTYLVTDSDEEIDIHVDDKGSVLNANGEIVGHIEINSEGEGVVVYNTQPQ